MKKILLFTAVIALLCVACKKNASPEEVVKSFYECYFNNDFENIQKYVTPEKKEYYQTIQKILTQTNGEGLEKIKVEDENIQLEYNEDKTIAVCTCDLVRNENNESIVEQGSLTLKKIDNQWFVDTGKEENWPAESDLDENGTSEQIDGDFQIEEETEEN